VLEGGLSGALVGAIACATRSRSDRSLIVVRVKSFGGEKNEESASDGEWICRELVFVVYLMSYISYFLSRSRINSCYNHRHHLTVSFELDS